MKSDTRSPIAKARSPENKAHGVSPEVKRKRDAAAQRRKVSAR